LLSRPIGRLSSLINLRTGCRTCTGLGSGTSRKCAVGLVQRIGDRTPRSKRGDSLCSSDFRKSWSRFMGPIVVTYDAEVVTYGVPTRGNPTSSPDRYPHLESPQLRQVMQPSIITTAAVEHLAHSCAPSGK